MFDLNPFARLPNLDSMARRYLWTVPLVALLGLVNGLLEGIGIGLLIPLLGTFMGQTGAGESGGVIAMLDAFGRGLDSGQRLILIALTMLLLMALKNILQVLHRMFIALIDGRAGHEIRSALAERLLQIGYPFHLSADPAHLVNIVSTESWHAADAIRTACARVSSGAAAAIFSLFLLAIEWRLTLVVLAGVLLIRLIQSAFVRRLRRLSQRISTTNRLLADRMLASVYQTRLIRLFRQEELEHRRFTEASENVRQSLFLMERLSAVMTPTLEMLHILLFMTVLMLATSLSVTLPVLATFLVLLNRLQPHLRAMESATAALASNISQVDEVEWLLNPAGKPPSASGHVGFRELKRGIEFHNVGFSYSLRPDAAPAITGASFIIREGRSTALIGRSGSGKSTVINLLCRLLEPTEGRIDVDGVSLSSLDPAQWLRAIGIAGQDIDLVDGTLTENIRYGIPGLPQEAVEEAARQADAHDFIQALPDGYESRVGTRGLNLSGGQRQRIGIARALARRPTLLILDEATSDVDGISESVILSLLRKVPRRLTLIVISHRTSTLALCDDGVVLDKGRVLEAGPLELLNSYRDMASR